MEKEVRRKLAVRKCEVQTIKFIPPSLSLICLIRTIVSFFGIELEFLSHLGGISFIMILFLYLSSYSFGFCRWHRLCIHYVSLNWIINIIDLYVGVPLDFRGMVALYISITGIFLILILLSIFGSWRKLCSQH